MVAEKIGADGFTECLTIDVAGDTAVEVTVFSLTVEYKDDMVQGVLFDRCANGDDFIVRS